MIPGLGRSPREENGHPLQYSCLENPKGLPRVEHSRATKQQQFSFYKLKWSLQSLGFSQFGVAIRRTTVIVCFYVSLSTCVCLFLLGLFPGVLLLGHQGMYLFNCNKDFFQSSFIFFIPASHL